MNATHKTIALLLVGLLQGSPARADVDLVTVPTRESTQLTIYNSADITMVSEQRLLTVKKGINRIQFSWANTLIDPTSVDFRILDHVDHVDLQDTTFPSGRNDALQWNISSRMAGKVPVEIRYFTSGITWTADYVGMANAKENELEMKGYVRVHNRSGEPYDNAEVRLVVGSINLVEAIADLAQRPASGERQYRELGKKERDSVRREMETKTESFFFAEGNGTLLGGMVMDKRKNVKKQGLSEYFLFTIGGREDIRNDEPRRLVAMEVDDIPLKAVYKLTDRNDDKTFTKFYRFENQKLLDAQGGDKDLPDMENLGVAPLPDGMVRLYSEYDNRDLAYVGGTKTKYVPIGDRVEVNVGQDQDITMVRRVKDRRISNVIARQYERRVNNTFVMDYDLIDYDETIVYEEEIVSGKSINIELEVERRFDANVVLWSEAKQPKDWHSDAAGAYVDLHDVQSRIEKIDENHVKYFLDMNPGQKQRVRYDVTYKRRKMGPELNQQKRHSRL
jgi:hypothetical protein